MNSSIKTSSCLNKTLNVQAKNILLTQPTRSTFFYSEHIDREKFLLAPPLRGYVDEHTV